MATVALGPASQELEKVLLLTNRLHSFRSGLENSRKEQEDEREFMEHCQNDSERLVFQQSLIYIGVEIRVLLNKIANLEKELEGLPKLCPVCRGSRILVSGMVDSYCYGCEGDGLTDGPHQRARTKRAQKMIRDSRK